MSKSQAAFRVGVLLLITFGSVCYAEAQIKADVNTADKKVIVFELDESFMLDIETAAFEQALIEAAERKPLFILLEIDTPGGRTDFARRICAAITRTTSCPVVAFVKGGKYGGAISAGAAVAFACNKLYMANNTIIGAATVITRSKSGRPEELKKVYGEDIGEKFSSAWRAYLASLAEQNSRSGLLARAMVDKDIEVIEVDDANQRVFLEPINKKLTQNIIYTWSKKGSLLTLTAAEAVKCGVADKVVDSRRALLAEFGAEDAQIITDKDIPKVRMELKRAKGQLNRIRKSVDFKVKQAQKPLPVKQILKILRNAENEFKTLIKLAKKYPDLNLNIEGLEDEVNTIKAASQRIKRESKSRRR